MTATTKDLETPRRTGALYSFPVASGVVIYANTLVSMDVTGYARPARASTTDRVIGRATAFIDNTNGTDGYDSLGRALNCEVETGIFRWVNGDSITLIAHRGAIVYAQDNQTVYASSNGFARVPAGRVVDVDSVGVWVATGDEAEGNISDNYSGTYTPTFTAGTNCASAGTLAGSFVRSGKIVTFAITVPAVVCAAGAPTVSAFEVSIPVASNFAAVTDACGTVTGMGVTLGRASASIANDRLHIDLSVTGGAASNDMYVTGQYQIL